MSASALPPDSRIISILPAETVAGQFLAGYSSRGLVRLEFPGQRTRVVATPPAPLHVEQMHRLTVAALENLMAGRRPPVMPPVDLGRGTAFQQMVWEELQKIPWGDVRSYGAIAAALGKPGGARAVGTACGANPIPLLVPCHRVLAGNGEPGGFSAGLPWKLKLLGLEGRPMPAQRP